MADIPIKGTIGQIKELHSSLNNLATAVPLKPFAEFEETLININNYAPKGAQGISRLKDQIKSLGDSTKYSKQQIADLLNFYTTSINSAAVSAQKYQDIIKKISDVGGSPAQAEQITKVVEALGTHSDALTDLVTKGKASKEALSDLAFVYATMGTAEGNLVTAMASGDNAYDERIKKLQQFNKETSNTNLTLSEGYASILNGSKAFDFLNSSVGQSVVQFGKFLAIVGSGYLAIKSIGKIIGWRGAARVAGGAAATAAEGAVAGGAAAAATGGITAGAILEILGGPIGWTALAASAALIVYNSVKNNDRFSPGGGSFGGHGGGGSWDSDQDQKTNSSIQAQAETSKSINAFLDNLKNINTRYSNSALPEGARSALLESQSNLAGSLGGAGVIGPQAQVRIAMDRIALLSEKQKSQEAELANAKNQTEIDNAKTAINDTLNQKLGLVQMARRSYTEQMIGGAIGMPNGGFTNPTLSDKFKYGSGYVDYGAMQGQTLSVTDMGKRKHHGSYQGTYGSLFNRVAGEAGGGLTNQKAKDLSDAQIVALGSLQTSVVNALGGYISKTQNVSSP